MSERAAEVSAPDFDALWPRTAPESDSADEPVRDGLPRLSRDALTGIAGDFVRIVEPQSEADPAAILAQFLAAAGNLIGPGPHCLVEATRHRMNLFWALVGESSKGRKGTAWGHVQRIGGLVDPQWSADRVTGGVSSSEGLIAEVQDDAEVPKDRRLLVMEPEFARALKVMSREGNTLSAVLRAAWDEGNLRTMTKREPQKATGAHITFVGHITRPELLRNLSDTESCNGFANRFLWVSVRRSKCLPEGGHVPALQMERIADRLRAVIEWSRTCARIQRDPDAIKLWAQVYPRLSQGLPGLLGAATSRAEAQVLRLSALYAVLDMSATIRVDHLLAALSLWEYCFASARCVFGDATGDPIADRIREAIENADEYGLSRTEISALFGRHAPTDRITQALTQLTALGVIERRVIKGEGRAAEFWCAKKAK